MRILALDPGAERMGWCVLEEGDENKPTLIASGYLGVQRVRNGSKLEPYQGYRLRLIDYWIDYGATLLEDHQPDIVTNEIIPVVGGGNFVVATQSQLAATAITVVQAVARQQQVPVKQVGATTVKANIGGTKKATKVGVRNGVFKLMPELAHRKKEWTKVFDESDAIAIGLAALGMKVK